jgi:hypothetical protein
MDYSAKDIMKIQVSMNYRYWTSGSTVLGDNGLIVNGKEALGSPGSQPGFGPFDDQQSFPNFDVDNSRLYPKF